ncbi:MAG: hypothetical protein FWG92_03780 [Leptospirales bacterium]|nr:hypothetical protein [Leptospirales bacterium]
MKRFTYLFFILSALFLFTGASNWEKGRLAWWTKHLGTLEGQKQKAADLADPAILDAIDREIDGAKRAISLFSGGRKNPASPLEERKNFTEAEIRAEAEKVWLPSSSLALISALNSGLPSKFNADLREVVRLSVYSMIDKNFIGDRDGLADSIVKSDITPQQWKTLENEISFELLMDAAPLYKRRAMDHMMNSAKTIRQKPVSISEVNAALLQEFHDFSGKHKPWDAITLSVVHLEKCKTWREMKERFERDFAVYAMILAKDPSGKKLPVNTLRSYYGNPGLIGNKSDDFIEKINEKKIPNPASILSTYEFGIGRGRERAFFASALFLPYKSKNVFVDPTLNSRLANEFHRVGVIFSSLREMSVFDSRQTKMLSEKSAADIDKKSSDYAALLASCRFDIGEAYKNYSSLAKESVRQEISDEHGINPRAAFELEETLRTLDDYTSLISTFDYSYGAFENYKRVYELTLDEARNGIIGAPVKKVIEDKSLIPSTADFDAAKIKSENFNRKFCAEKIKTLRSRIGALAKSHKTAGVAIKGAPSANEFDDAINAAEKRPSVAIGTWTMTADNFELTDKKAALVIERAVSGSMWRQSSNVTLENNHKVALEQINLNINLPAFWNREENARMPGSFKNLDGSARIIVTSIPLGEKPLNEVSWKWVSRGGSEPVRGRWGKSEELGNYFHCVARKGNDSVRECYVIEKDGQLIIIEGETSRSKYNFFAGKLEAIFKSVSIKN